MLKIGLEMWEGDEVVITVDGKPIGYTLSKHQGMTIRGWLESALEDLTDIISDAMDNGDRRD